MTNVRFIRVAPVAQRLGVSDETIRRWAAAGRLPPLHRIGPRCLGWPVEIIEPALAALLAPAAAA